MDGKTALWNENIRNGKQHCKKRRVSKTLPWSIVTSKASLAHAGTIVTDQSSNVLVTHFDFLFCFWRRLFQGGGCLTSDMGLGSQAFKDSEQQESIFTKEESTPYKEKLLCWAEMLTGHLWTAEEKGRRSKQTTGNLS